MLIVTADDYGKSRHATDGILKCFSNNRITAASGMVFMEDSVRAASLALKAGLEVGLHLNFTEPFSSGETPAKLRQHHHRVTSYLSRHKLAQLMYNPFLAKSFNQLFLAQEQEFMRLYGKSPAFYNGHHHMHLCINILANGIIPKGSRLRATFTFAPGEKGFFNLIYRNILNLWLSKRFISTDFFFSIEPVQDDERLRSIVTQAEKQTVELEVHPEKVEEMRFLLSDKYKDLLRSVHTGSFRDLTRDIQIEQVA